MKKWLTEPNFVYGIVFGLAFSILGGFLILTEVFTFGLLGLFVVLAFFVAGAMVGSLSAKFAKKRAVKKASELFPQLVQAGVDLSFDIQRVHDQSPKEEVDTLLNKHSGSMREVIGELSQWAGTLYLRVAAMGALFTMLGILISFAVFWATFLQVTRLEEQIQTTKTAKQVDIALSIASNYQYLVNGFIDDISSRPGFANGPNYLSKLGYKRLVSTLRQLKPYTGVDIHSGELTDVPNSPEQSFILHYLIFNEVLLSGSKVKLHGLTAHNLDIHHGELASVDFYQSDLRNSAFYKSILTKANFYEAILVDCQFTASSLNGADFTGANLKNADFTGSDLNYASFKNADLRDADFKDVGDWKTITSIEGANIKGLKNAPEGFLEWAKKGGAISE